MKISRYFAGTAAVLLAGALTACGGGGGGGGGVSGGAGGSGGDATALAYHGNTSPAVVTTANASVIVAVAFSGGDVSTTTSRLSTGSQPQGAQGQVDIGRWLKRAVRGTVRSDVTSRLTSDPVDQTDRCSGGGTVRVFGDQSPSGTGMLTIVYSNCVEGGDSTNGQATLRIDGYDMANDLITDYSMSFARLALRGSSNMDISGSLRVVTNLGANSETSSENIVALYLDNGRMTKSENLVFIDLYTNLLNPSAFSEGISGRLYHSVHGYVDIATATPFLYANLTAVFPVSGQMVVTGAGNARIRLTAFSGTLVELALDLDNNGVFERQARLNWADVPGPVGADLADSDGDGMHNSWEIAFGLNPNVNDAAGDLDNDGVTNLAEYQAGTPPNLPNSTLPPPPSPGPLPPGPASGVVVLLPDNSDIVFDAVSQKIYAAVRSGAGNPGSVVAIDPATGGIVGLPIPVGIEPVKLAASNDGQFLYVGLDGQPDVQRINLATKVVDLTITLGSDPVFSMFGPWYAEDIEVLPGSPQSIAVSLKFKSVSPRHGGVAIYDGNVRRSAFVPGHAGTGNANNVIEFSSTAGTLYGYNNETSGFGFSRIAVSATGATLIDVYTSFDTPQLISGYGTDIRFGGGFVFSTEGKMVDPVARVVVPNPDPTKSGPTFTLPGQFGYVAPDGALSRVFFLVNEGGWSIRAYDMGSRLLIGSASVSEVRGMPGSLIRWGAKGLAFRTSGGQIFILQSPSWIP